MDLMPTVHPDDLGAPMRRIFKEYTASEGSTAQDSNARPNEEMRRKMDSQRDDMEFIVNRVRRE